MEEGHRFHVTAYQKATSVIAYPLEIEKVVAKAADTGTAPEINAQPLRMDKTGE